MEYYSQYINLKRLIGGGEQNNNKDTLIVGYFVS